MTIDAARDAETQALRHFLDYQRNAVLSIVEGLDEEAWNRAIVPSGWTRPGCSSTSVTRSATGSRTS